MQPAVADGRPGAVMHSRRALPSVALAVLVAVAIVGCGSAVPRPSGAGQVAVSAVRGDHLFVGSHQEVRLVGSDGAIVTGAAVPPDAPAILAGPAGEWTLEAFTVFVSDFGECVADPAASSGTRCFLPTLEPTTFCRLPITIVEERTLDVTLTTLQDGCRLEVAPPTSTSPS
jgi:hypothetical protein